MKIDAIMIGQKVADQDDNEGVVESFDYDENVVYVRMPIPGHPDQTDLVDIDPGDLHSVTP